MKKLNIKHIYKLSILTLAINTQTILPASQDALAKLASVSGRLAYASYETKYLWLRKHENIADFAGAFEAYKKDILTDPSAEITITFPGDLITLNTLGFLNTPTGRPSRADLLEYVSRRLSAQ